MGALHLLDVFSQFYHDNPSIIITNLMFLFIKPISDILLPHLYGKVMTSMENKGNVYTPLIYVTLVMAIVQILYLLSHYHDSKLFPRLQCYIREQILRKILKNYEEQYTELELGSIISKIIKLPQVMVEWFERMKNYVIPSVIVFIIASIYFIYQDLQLGLALFLVLLLFTILIIMSPLTCGKISYDRDKCFNIIHEKIDDILRNLFSVYGTNQKEVEFKDLATFTSKHTALFEDTVNCVLKLKFFMTPLTILYLIFFIRRCYILMNSNKMPTSKFISIFIILIYVLGLMESMNDEINDIIVEWGIMESSSDIIMNIPKKVTDDDNKLYSIPQYGIGFHNVSFSYPDNNKMTLRNISFHIGKGEKVCITGDIGSGKSTIIKLLLKYNIANSGTIYWDGRDYKDIDILELRSKLGYVPQQPVLFNRTIIQNILYGNSSYTRQDVEVILKKFDISSEFEKFDQGLDTVIGKNGSKLSGGQRQLVWCLRVLLSNPDIIILDEPTASIDEKTKVVLHNMLNTLMTNKTVIMVTHDPFLVDIATRTISMKNGIIL